VARQPRTTATPSDRDTSWDASTLVVRVADPGRPHRGRRLRYGRRWADGLGRFGWRGGCARGGHQHGNEQAGENDLRRQEHSSRRADSSAPGADRSLVKRSEGPLDAALLTSSGNLERRAPVPWCERGIGLCSERRTSYAQAAPPASDLSVARRRTSGTSLTGPGGWVGQSHVPEGLLPRRTRGGGPPAVLRREARGYRLTGRWSLLRVPARRQQRRRIRDDRSAEGPRGSDPARGSGNPRAGRSC
jgi:hypothetical protein